MRRIFLLCILATTCAIAKAQVYYGVKGGANLSTIVGDDVQYAHTRVGLHTGIFAGFPVTTRFVIQSEIVYSAQGARFKVPGWVDQTTRLNYLNIPLLAKYSTGSGVYGITGPQIGFRLSAKSVQDDSKNDLKEYYKPTDFSWAFGLGYKTSCPIGFDFRYNLGISRNFKLNGTSSIRNSVFQVGVFYLLKHK